MKIQRFRKFNTRDVYPGGRHDNDMCMTVRAGASRGGAVGVVRDRAAASDGSRLVLRGEPRPALLPPVATGLEAPAIPRRRRRGPPDGRP